MLPACLPLCPCTNTPPPPPHTPTPTPAAPCPETPPRSWCSTPPRAPWPAGAAPRGAAAAWGLGPRGWQTRRPPPSGTSSAAEVVVGSVHDMQAGPCVRPRRNHSTHRYPDQPLRRDGNQMCQHLRVPATSAPLRPRAREHGGHAWPHGSLLQADPAPKIRACLGCRTRP